jgi:hypothetical protein
MVLLVLLVLSGCGSDGGAALDIAPQDPGLMHVHGLGVSGDAVYIATHTGMWKSAAGSTSAERIGTDTRDVMGFTVAGDRFLGSGHPAPSATDLPPLLGLIESRDGGGSWAPVSLLGETDFHTLRASGDTIYGADATSGRLYVSTDGGRRWTQHAPPGPVIDLAIDPGDARRVVAATEDGLHESRDGGRRWRPLGRAVGLLAWPARERLYVVDGSGAVGRSDDGGRRFTRAGEVGGQPAAFVADGERLLVARHDAGIVESRDGGATWTVRVEASATRDSTMPASCRATRSRSPSATNAAG